jgi:DNA phosphorothioation-dependent restriction protein DptF
LQSSNFEFLKIKFPKLAELGQQIEDVFYQDSQTVLIKGRIFSEELLKEVAIQHEDLENMDYLRLIDKIQYLEKEEILSKQIARSFDTIRHLGNKASHEYIDTDLENAFKMHKRLFEISVWLMEVYGDYSFVSPKYKIPQPKSNEEMIKKLEEKLTSNLEEKLELILAGTNVNKDSVSSTNPNGFIAEDKVPFLNDKGILNKHELVIREGESYLLKELSKLKESSQEAIENPNQFSIFKEYLHIKRSIQDDLEIALKTSISMEQSQLILLCGSVGDGKSHLLSYMKNEHPELINQFSIHNDATESFDPQKSSLDTLSEILNPFSDENINSSDEKLILAINLGVLHNFIESKFAKENYKILTKFIVEGQVFEAFTLTESRRNQFFQLISFSEYQPFELTDEGPLSYYFSSLLNKLIDKSDDNPFYKAYLKDKENKIHNFYIANFELLMLKKVREVIVELLIKAIIKHKTIISTRSLLNFIHDILVPANQEVDYFNSDAITKTENLLPNLMFEGKERSHLLAIIAELDPIHNRSILFDDLLIELNNTSDIKKTFSNYINLDDISDWKSEIEKIGAFNELSNSSKQLFNKTLLRFSYFLSEEINEVFIDQNYKDYLKYLYHFNTNNTHGIKPLYLLLKEAVFLWNGRPKSGYIFIDKSNQDIHLAQSLNIKPFISTKSTDHQSSPLERFSLTLSLAFSDEYKNNPIYFELDYPLFEMLIKLTKGYRPNKKDKEDCIQFGEFIEKLMTHGKKEKELLFVNLHLNKSFKLSYDEDFDEFAFRRE